MFEIVTQFILNMFALGLMLDIVGVTLNANNKLNKYLVIDTFIFMMYFLLLIVFDSFISLGNIGFMLANISVIIFIIYMGYKHNLGFIVTTKNSKGKIRGIDIKKSTILQLLVSLMTIGIFISIVDVSLAYFISLNIKGSLYIVARISLILNVYILIRVLIRKYIKKYREFVGFKDGE